MSNISNCTVYIDEAGDLGFCRGTRWFVLAAVIVDTADEPHIRSTLSQIKTRINVREIHLRSIRDFYKKVIIVRDISDEPFTYMTVIADTGKFDKSKIVSSALAYNYSCRILLERVSWYLRDTNRTADIVLSARGTSRDNELIDYITQKLIPYSYNEINGNVFNKVCAKSAGSWEMLQLADICATTMFHYYEINGYGFSVPCFTRTLRNHLYSYNGEIRNYGIKYFSNDMQPEIGELSHNWPCKQKERTPGATTTC